MGKDIVIFGADVVGLHTLKGLRKMGIEPRCFAVDRPNAERISGVPVYKTLDAVKAFQSALFVVSVFQGRKIITMLEDVGMNAISFPKFYRRFPDVFLPYLSLELMSRVPVDGVDMFDDMWSKREYIGQYNWRRTLDFNDLPPHLPIKDIYFPADLFTLGNNETFVDCGAYDGDTIKAFRAHGGAGQIIAFEPDPDNCARLRLNNPTVTCIPYALSSVPGRVRFSTGFGVASAIGNLGQLATCETLDNMLFGMAPTLIKMDIEGAELDALHGAEQTIAKHHPILAICLYHRPDDLWKIPQYVKSLHPDYNLFMRRYAEDCWEEVLYAVPPERML